MENMKVITLTRFNDKLCECTREEGDIFEVSPERYAQIMAYRQDLIQPYEAEGGSGEDAIDPEGAEAPTGEAENSEGDAEGGSGEEVADPEGAQTPTGEEQKSEAEKKAEPKAAKAKKPTKSRASK